MSDIFISATKARNNFFDLLEKVKKKSYPIHITVKGIPEAVIMSKADYDSLIATLETLSDSDLVEAIRKGEKDIKAGRYFSLEEVEKELGEGGYLVFDEGKRKYVPSDSGKPGKKRVKKA